MTRLGLDSWYPGDFFFVWTKGTIVFELKSVSFESFPQVHFFSWLLRLSSGQKRWRRRRREEVNDEGGGETGEGEKHTKGKNGSFEVRSPTIECI